MGKARRAREARRAEVTSFVRIPVMANWNEVGQARAAVARIALEQAGDRARSGVTWREWPVQEIYSILPAMYPDPNDDEQALIDSAMAFAGSHPDGRLIVAEVEVAVPPRTMLDFVKEGPTVA